MDFVNELIAFVVLFFLEPLIEGIVDFLLGLLTIGGGGGGLV